MPKVHEWKSIDDGPSAPVWPTINNGDDNGLSLGFGNFEEGFYVIGMSLNAMDIESALP